ncbi:hypothetical protein [Spirosoma taeanense]|uniref:hypothetical protein n=1 Tax=Spirosoma taeanense TaxID=2735870 RepID=UPI001F03F271|nr:hypothetical protein [Spirosoma taeanense]
MRLSSLLISFLLSIASLAQSTDPNRRPKSVIYSASSDWQKVTLKRTPRLRRETTAATTPRADEPTVREPSVVPATLPTSPVVTATPQPTVTRFNVPTLQNNYPDNVPVVNNTTAEPGTQPSRTASTRTNASGFRPAFTGDFATNRNGWKAGNKGDYNYQIGLGKYSIRKRRMDTQQAAFSFVPLPVDINLNIADVFTIKVDIVADSGQVPTGGVLFGVLDSLNYSAFLLNGKGEIAIVRVTNGETSDDYMPGDYFKPGILLERNRDRLIIRRKGEALHFYINEREVRSSPYPFKMLAGNGIGLTTTGYWTSFQKLSVTLGP